MLLQVCELGILKFNLPPRHYGPKPSTFHLCFSSPYVPVHMDGACHVPMQLLAECMLQVDEDRPVRLCCTFARCLLGSYLKS